VKDLLPVDFYARDALAVARDLLGMQLCRGGVLLRITEVEAYRWPDDSANHGRHGRTARNDALWGPPGLAYVYRCYGVHNLLNLVTGSDGEAAAVLIRACEPMRGLATIRRRRNGLEGPTLLNGPGKVGAALGLDTGWSRHRLYEAGGLEARFGESPAGILAGPRVGVAYARPEHRRAPWRLAAANTAWVGHRRGLMPV
jgi:DNA-3-methyladenine glycosylase